MTAWATLHLSTGDIHVVPLDDLRDHESTECWCHPAHEEEDGTPIVVHRAMDERERYERGELKAH